MDMRASGDSDGQFCTLGLKESKDVRIIIREIQQRFKVEKMILYGRSMGAAALMKFVEANKKGTVY